MRRNKHFESAINNFAEGLLALGVNQYSNYSEFVEEHKKIREEFDFGYISERVFKEFHVDVVNNLKEYKYAKRALRSLLTKYIPGESGYENTLTNAFLSDILNGDIKINSRALEEFIDKYIDDGIGGKWLTFKSPYICSVCLKYFNISSI